MPAYIVFIREEPVADSDAIAAYSASNRANAGLFVEQFGLKPLAVYGAQQVLEGKEADGVVLLQFPTMAQAQAWYRSPGYAPLLALRKTASQSQLVITEGL